MPTLLSPQLAAHLSQFDAAFAPVARRFASMVARFADELQLQVVALQAAAGNAAAEAGAADPEAAEAAVAERARNVAALGSRQLRWRSMAAACYAAGPLRDKDAGQLAQLVVRVCRR